MHFLEKVCDSEPKGKEGLNLLLDIFKLPVKRIR